MKAPTFLLLALAPLIGSAQAVVDIDVVDGPVTNILTSGQPLSLSIRVRGAGRDAGKGLSYEWRDFRGNAVSPGTPLGSGTTEVTAPTAKPGYLGLAFVADDPDVRINPSTGLRQELGFVFVPSANPPARAAGSPFGIVHPDLDDPNMPTWVKTLTWNTTSARYWPDEIAKRRDAGYHELPLVSGNGWAGDDSSNIADAQLDELSSRFGTYISADPNVRYWELGREENLGRRFEQSAYFDNLAAKAAALRRAAVERGISVKFIYQIGGRSLTDARKFFASDAAEEFDIVAPHPYYWPEFPTPEKWLARFIGDRRAAMQENGLDMPMWFTEIGAPQNDARLPTMYSGRHPVPGHRREENAAYLVKTHVIALASGVEKVFWYNYVDRKPDISDVEEHFGLIDYWGYPKPAYAAYVTTLRCIGNKRPAARSTAAGLHVYRFSAAGEHCVVLWSHPDAAATVSFQSIIEGVPAAKIDSISDTVGAPMTAGDALEIDGYPVFLRMTSETAAKDSVSDSPD
ncbi:MAG: hypothetical protein KJO31_05400 [Gammaproteobacteria bacterium]|nr:hypothetical protein [Gammaproteobacteria bacterium]